MLGAFILAAMLAPDTDNNVIYQVFPLLLFLLVVARLLELFFRVPILRDAVVAPVRHRWPAAQLPHRREEPLREDRAG